MGFINEHWGDIAKADFIYKDVLNRYPDYLDANLRLSHMAFKRGDPARAIMKAKL